jgi:hypothetical protein
MIQKEFQQHVALLAHLLKKNLEPARAYLQLPSHAIEFTRFLNRHGLQLPVLFLLKNSRSVNILPRNCLDQLRAFSLAQWRVQENLTRQLTHLTFLLSDAGYEHICLKGPCLGERFYGGTDRRAFGDLDILIRRNDLPAVDLLLRKAGFTRQSTVLFNTALSSRFVHAFDYTKTHVTLDLHWRLSANAAHLLDYDTVWQQRQVFALREHRVSVLSDEYEIVFNLVSLFKDIERGAIRLKAFADLYFILKVANSSMDWKQFLSNRGRERILGISVNVLTLFLEMFQCRDEFAEMAGALESCRGLIQDVSPIERFELIQARQGSLNNKLWASRLYDCSRFHVFMWWLVSLPFRLAAHNADRYGRPRRRLEEGPAKS